MIRTLDASMLNLPYSIPELAPLAAAHGIEGLSAPAEVLEDERAGAEAAAVMKDLGLKWGLMPMTADFYHWGLDDAAFDEALERLRRRAEKARKLGITHAYNHVWPTTPLEFDEAFEWTVKRVRAVSTALNDQGIHYGLEFLGPHELRTWQPHEFVHSIAGVMAIADAAGGIAGIAFDTFHWYCSNNGAPDDLMLMVQHIDRLVAVHLNDAVAGVPYNLQRDMQRRLPLETGVIDSRRILSCLKAQPNDALYMIEPFEPHRTRFHDMSAEEAVRAAAEVFARLEA